MPQHKEFDTAGKKPGLQVWCIEKMDLAPVPPELHGNFYTGDSYILLHTTSAPSYNVHSWFGDETSQDERGAAAIFMIQEDDFLHGAPIQFTEFQNQESNSFLSYFKYGITYKKCGVASGFKHTMTNELDTQRLIHVKGRRVIKASEVAMNWSSFNRGDCFIIQLKECIYHWAGSSEPEAVIQVLGPKPDLPASSDIINDKENQSMASLYMISDAAGSMKATLVVDKNPFKQEMLSPGECYILDNGRNHQLLVWKGSDANKDERQASMRAASQFIDENNYPKKTQIIVMPAGGESTLFKQFFPNWLDKDETTGPSKAYTIGSIANVEQIPFDASKLHDNKVMAAQRRHASLRLVQGLKGSKDELTVQLDDSMGGAATQVRSSL
ncbi:hypothetical protein CesoFtcFv8_004564 [Champsocephalus esox]|uniref:Gelsolin-like domain-containing protein n=1 Tax=Champsocephalus esox TaxID=159716 RepID=A0AAN8H8T4_9TELE|nr:hypothetical protein CesoFtcFv8_004564 [Champsocephalus esox]